MAARYGVLFIALLIGLGYASAEPRPPANQERFPPTYVPSGEQLFRQYCASCHGSNAKGHGPAADSLKRPPADLTTLAVRHGGKFPYAYVSDVLKFGPGVKAHGSADMPAWGPIFLFLDKSDEAAVEQRIKNLNDYLASLQVGKKPAKATPTEMPKAH